MHILLVHDSKLPPKHYGGIERIVVTLTDEYRRQGHKVSILCKKGSRVEGAGIIELPDAWDWNIDKIIPNDIDFIHSHQPLAMEPRRPYLITIHGNGQIGETYFPNTNFLSKSHASNHNSKVVVFNGIDPARYTFNKNKEDYYIFLARTTWRVKNLKTCIQWAKDLNVKLKIIGGNGISRGNIEYLGFVDDKVKNEALGKAKALIYPTNWDEPCAGAPLEALACGTPVIATKNGCMPEMVNHGETGALCETYQDLLRAPEVLKSVSYEKCREKIENEFSVKRMASDYLALFEKIIKDGPLVSKDSLPKYNFKKSSVRFLFKPTVTNRLRHALTGKI